MSTTRRNLIASIVGIASAGVPAAANATTYQPDRSIVPLLGTIPIGKAKALSDTPEFKSPPAFLGTIPTPQGASLLVFDTALQLDTDGWQGYRCGDCCHSANTTLTLLEKRAPLDANRIPYFVLPSPRPWASPLGIELGDYAAVLFQGHMAFAVFGDQGKPDELGEGSLELLRRLGHERLLPNGCVRDVGTQHGALTIVFPRSHTRDERRTEQTLLEAINSQGRAHFLAAGGRPSAQQ